MFKLQAQAESKRDSNFEARELDGHVLLSNGSFVEARRTSEMDGNVEDDCYNPFIFLKCSIKKFLVPCYLGFFASCHHSPELVIRTPKIPIEWIYTAKIVNLKFNIYSSKLR